MKKLLTIPFVLLALAGCSFLSTTGEDYAGVNFANVTLPNG